MLRVKNCAICKNAMILDFDKGLKKGVCPACGTPYQYRLLGKSMYELISDLIPEQDDYLVAQCG